MHDTLGVPHQIQIRIPLIPLTRSNSTTPQALRDWCLALVRGTAESEESTVSDTPRQYT